MALVRNEQAKLTATYLNNLAVALAAVGGITPMVSGVLAAGGPTRFDLATGLICILGSGALHFMARGVLRGLEP